MGVTDFVLLPSSPPRKLRLRLRRLTQAAGNDEIHHFKDLELNLLTYQATLGPVPVDLTYMEYELLRFFVERQAPGLDPRAIAVEGVGIRVLRRSPHRRCPRPPASGQARRGASVVDNDGAIGGLPVRYSIELPASAESHLTSDVYPKEIPWARGRSSPQLMVVVWRRM